MSASTGDRRLAGDETPAGGRLLVRPLWDCEAKNGFKESKVTGYDGVAIATREERSSTNGACSHSLPKICNCVGIRTDLLLPRVCGALFTFGDDPATRHVVRHYSAGRRFDPGVLLLHLFDYQPGRRGGSRPLGCEVAGSGRGSDPRRGMSFVWLSGSDRR
jgi:hypothetical protein